MYGLGESDVSRYVTFSFVISFIISLFSVLFLYGLSLRLDVIGFYPLTFVLLFALFFYGILSLPSQEYKRKIRKIEFELPFIARILGAFIESRVPFDTSLEKAISFSDTLKAELGHLKSRVLSSKMLLTSFYKRYNTPMIQRFVAYILSVYETGGQGDKLVNLSDDLFSVVRSKLSDNSSKLSLLSMILVAVLVLLPTFLLIVSAVLNISVFSSGQGVFLIFFILIPLVAFVLILLSSSFVIKRIQLPYLEFFMIFLIGLLEYLFVVNGLIQAVIVVISVGAIFLLFRKKYRESKRLEKIDRLIPDGLMTLESLGRGVFKTLALANLGELSAEAKKSYLQIKSRVSEKKALDDFYQRNPTKNVLVFCKVVETAYELGSMRHIYGIAESIFKSEEVFRYSQQLNGMQRYTLMLGVILLPLLLSISSNVVHTMAGLGGAIHGVNIDMILIPYMLIYDALAALYIAQVSEKKSEFYVNLVLFSIISLVVIFLFSSNINISLF